MLGGRWSVDVVGVCGVLVEVREKFDVGCAVGYLVGCFVGGNGFIVA